MCENRRAEGRYRDELRVVERKQKGEKENDEVRCVCVCVGLVEGK